MERDLSDKRGLGQQSDTEGLVDRSMCSRSGYQTVATGLQPANVPPHARCHHSPLCSKFLHPIVQILRSIQGSECPRPYVKEIVR